MSSARETNLDQYRIARGRPVMSASIRAARLSPAAELGAAARDLERELINHLRSVSIDDIFERPARMVAREEEANYAELADRIADRISGEMRLSEGRRERLRAILQEELAGFIAFPSKRKEGRGSA